MQPISTLLLLSSVASTAFGVTHTVQVAVDKTLTYTPNSIVAAVGDQVEFDFLNGVSFFPNRKSEENSKKAFG
jgi:plastocyanin